MAAIPRHFFHPELVEWAHTQIDSIIVPPITAAGAKGPLLGFEPETYKAQAKQMIDNFSKEPSINNTIELATEFDKLIKRLEASSKRADQAGLKASTTMLTILQRLKQALQLNFDPAGNFNFTTAKDESRDRKDSEAIAPGTDDPYALEDQAIFSKDFEQHIQDSLGYRAATAPSKSGSAAWSEHAKSELNAAKGQIIRQIKQINSTTAPHHRAEAMHDLVKRICIAQTHSASNPEESVNYTEIQELCLQCFLAHCPKSAEHALTSLTAGTRDYQATIKDAQTRACEARCKLAWGSICFLPVLTYATVRQILCCPAPLCSSESGFEERYCPVQDCDNLSIEPNPSSCDLFCGAPMRYFGRSFFEQAWDKKSAAQQSLQTATNNQSKYYAENGYSFAPTTAYEAFKFRQLAGAGAGSAPPPQPPMN